MLRARFDALSASGRPGAVKKAIEKKQRKLAQKDKKSRPFPSLKQKEKQKEEGRRPTHQYDHDANQSLNGDQASSFQPRKKRRTG